MLMIIIAIALITVIARGRGGSPWLWGVIAGVGYFVVVAVVQAFAAATAVDGVPTGGAVFFGMAAPWVWFVSLGLGARFLIGARQVDKPTGSWTCGECSTVNAHYALVCDACREPFRPPVE